ncbi:MAG: AbrB/MazE/SpoVT family DNA-binding domain-containing protein [Candidatus Thermoplasmatota archaeon]
MHLTVAVKKVGNSLAIFIPADKARAASIREGDIVEADLEAQGPHLLGRFKGIGPYTLADKKAAWPDED